MTALLFYLPYLFFPKRFQIPTVSKSHSNEVNGWILPEQFNQFLFQIVCRINHIQEIFDEA